MANATAITNGIFMIGLLTAGAGMSAYVFFTPEMRSTVTKPLPAGQYIDGEITASIESQLRGRTCRSGIPPVPCSTPSPMACSAKAGKAWWLGRPGGCSARRSMTGHQARTKTSR